MSNQNFLKVKSDLELGLPVLFSFSLPISTGLTTFCIVSLWLLWLMGGDLKKKFALYWRQPITPILLLIFGLYLVGCLYSVGNFDQQLERLSDGSKLLLIPILIYFFSDLKTAKRAFLAFMVAMVITLFLAILKIYAHLPIGDKYTDAAVFKNHIDTNFFMALALFYTLYLIQFTQEKRWLLISVACLMLYYIFFLSVGRIGYLAVFMFGFYLAYERMGKKGIAVGFLAVVGLAFLLYLFSQTFHNRVDQLFQDWHYYQEGKLLHSSLGSRLQFYLSSLQLMGQRLLFGWGTGGFSSAYDWLSHGAYLHTDNPHNEFLRIGVEFGLVGIALFSWLFYKQWSWINSMPEHWQILAKATLLLFLMGCFLNSWLIDFTQTCFYVVFSGLTGAYIRVMKPGDLVPVRLH